LQKDSGIRRPSQYFPPIVIMMHSKKKKEKRAKGKT